jgi:hypothetical protein
MEVTATIALADRLYKCYQAAKPYYNGYKKVCTEHARGREALLKLRGFSQEMWSLLW